MFSNFQATFPLIFSKVFGIFIPNFTTEVREKYDLTFGTKITVDLKKIGGRCCGSCQALLIKMYIYGLDIKPVNDM